MKAKQIRISCEIVAAVETAVRKNPMFFNTRKFIELATLEKLAKLKEKK